MSTVNIRRVLLGLVVIEALSALALSGYGIFSAVTASGRGLTVSVGLTVFLVIFGLVLALVLGLSARGLAQNKRAARAPVLLTQVFAILIAGQSALATPSVLNISVLVVAIAVIVLLLLFISRAEPGTSSDK